jgi:hypothetical protein
MSVLGAPTVDGWFGAGTALSIWETAMKLGGYVYDCIVIIFSLLFKKNKLIVGIRYDPSSDTVQGMGYSMNQQAEAFSGEWTFGAINMLRIFAT